MSKLFGTDGVRGVAGEFVTAELAQALGWAAASELGDAHGGAILIARDTRASGPMLQASLSRGVAAAGVDVVDLGVLPTPAVAFLVTRLGARAGAVVSASHNPASDNGIKFFGPDGYKLSDEQQSRIERLMQQDFAAGGGGRIHRLADAGTQYVEHALEALEGRRLDGMKVVVDCANGAAFSTAPEAFRRAGAQLTVLNEHPDGVNINADCGSQHPEGLAARVRETGSALGLAFDGDADRVVAVDERGNLVDGDSVIAALAVELKEQTRLPNNLVVSTVMANLGFRVAMDREGIELVETPVGDRYVIEAMRERGAALGGEQSGHIIFSGFSTTGDGLITGLRLAARMASTGRSLSDLAGIVEKFPQVLINVRVDHPELAGSSEQLNRAVASARELLGDSGRVLVRASGTEPLVRVMVEARLGSTASEVASGLAALVQGKSESP